ncbi:MAG TPA: hypothetical protein VLK33_23030 [Terriglobales bacterium]|nr:hypothetical protein [Terriglobales bacterium]
MTTILILTIALIAAVILVVGGLVATFIKPRVKAESFITQEMKRLEKKGKQ